MSFLRNITATIRGRRPADDPGDMPCRDVVEIVTSYLEGDLDPSLRARFEAHLADCPDCALYVDQMRQTVGLTGATGHVEELAPELRAHLEHVFEDWVAADSDG